MARTLISGGTSTYIHYVYDEDGHVLGEYNGATGAVLREYVWLDDMPVAVVDSTSGTATTYYIHTGHLDEPQVMTNASKAKVWDAYVNPFGKATTFASPTVNSDVRLPGQSYQAESAAQGLNQNHFRDYDPSLGRYIEADPLGIDAGQNPYAYVDGRPYDFSDRNGRCIEDLCIGEAILVGEFILDAYSLYKLITAVPPRQIQPVGRESFNDFSSPIYQSSSSSSSSCSSASSQSSRNNQDHCELEYQQEKAYCNNRYGVVRGQYGRCLSRADQNFDLCLQDKNSVGWWRDINEDGWEAPRPSRRK